jgi:hypothetical protein
MHPARELAQLPERLIQLELQLAERLLAAAKISVPALDRHVLAETLTRLARSAAVDASRKRSDEIAERRTRLDEAERELTTYLAAVSAVDVGEAGFAHGARARRDKVDEARRQLAATELRAASRSR